MRGNPATQLLLILVGFGLTSILLAGITQRNVPKPHATQSTVTTTHKELSAWVKVRFAHSPSQLEIFQGEKSLLKQNDPEETIEEEVTLQFEDGFCDLKILCQWKEGTPETAITVVLEPDAESSQEFTFWGEESMEKQFTLRLKP